MWVQIRGAFDDGIGKCKGRTMGGFVFVGFSGFFKFSVIVGVFRAPLLFNVGRLVTVASENGSGLKML